ncbi:hypothetical protein [Streptomyces sp. NPDC046712]|uniref:hypothetical protein n=1 Tax=Streptomyces sp. NPDC046712 TaxID=3154802 RepID=UPI0033C7111E
MSATLAVSLLLSDYENDLADGAVIVGDIYPADPQGVTRTNILIPCGDAPTPKEYEVPAGRYVVSARLPSGIVLSAEAEAREGPPTPVRLNMVDSPYESHSWQYLLGNIERNRVYHDSSSEIPLAESRGSRSMVAPAPGPDGVIPESAPDQSAVVTWVGDSTPPSWSFASMLALDKDRTGGPVAPEIARGPVGVLPRPEFGDAISPLYRFGPDGPVGAPAGPVGERQFLIVETAMSTRLVTLPLPWGTSQVEVLVNLRQSPTGSAVAVAVRDPAVGAGLAYMAQGALDTAAQLFSDVEGLLYSKFENPIAAAAGAYVLLGTDHTEGETYWDPWLERLREGFTWLSDGAILRGMRLLRRARSTADRLTARDVLIEAFDRGIPYYTLGLAWLIDGLSAFPDDFECVRRLDQARRLSWLADMREPFLILDLREGDA